MFQENDREWYMKKQRMIRPMFVIGFALVIGLVGFYRYGRAMWSPVLTKIRGKRTVSSVLKKLKPSLKKRIPGLTGLTSGKPLALVAIKDKMSLELWQKRKGKYHFVKAYPFTAYSGKLGPKLREGDGQIPEGIYRITFMHPNSSYYLSMKVSYPNRFDRKKGRLDGRKRLGGDIFIHGKAVTIGCIPVGDKAIEELFYIIGKNGYRRTKVIIAPYDMRVKKKKLKISGITWEKELYRKIRKALKPFKKGR